MFRLFFCLLVFVFMEQLSQAEEPLIDVVYTWVDGSDEEWQKSRLEWMQKTNPEAAATGDSTAARRFRDREELRYSLRSLVQFAPFIHHIYIVTCGHKPKWLLEHPKVTVISHKEFFAKSSDLPTFNSMAIEANLHRIPGLSEKYIYFNDDVFLARPAKPSDFFTQEGHIRVFLSKHLLERGPPLNEEKGYYSASKNTADLLALTFGSDERYFHAHTPFPSRVSIASMSERMFPSVFALVSSHRFRSKQDFTLTNGVIPYVALQKGLGVVSPFESFTWSLGKDTKEDVETAKALLAHPPQFLCIQDSLREDDDEEKVAVFLRKFLTSLYPEKAPWEYQK